MFLIISSLLFFLNHILYGIKREFIVTLPENYDNTKSYPLIFAWHGLGGSADSVVKGTRFIKKPYFGLLKASENQAIFIADQGLSRFMLRMGSNSAWENKNGRDVAFVNTLINWAKSNLPIDESRIFSIGFSYGGMFLICSHVN